MKYILSCCFSLLSLVALAQSDSMPKPIEPDMETSFENYELLIIAIVGFVLLMVIRYWFKHTRKK